MKNKAWIEAILRELDFVDWDRYFPFGEHLKIYGWIEREKDPYKDFVLLELKHSEKEVFAFDTSSSKYSKKIDRILFEDDGLEHNECQRVESKFKIENMIELESSP